MKKIYIYAAMATLMMGMFTSCNEDSLPDNFAPTFDNTKNQATDIYRTGAILQGSLNAKDNTRYDQCGIMYSKFSDMTKGDTIPVVVGSTTANQTISAHIQGLESGVTYFYCVYAKSGSTYIKGDVNNFTTPSTSGPTIVNTEATVAADQYTSCKVTSEVQDDGGTDLFLGGYIYKKVESATDVAEFKFNDEGVQSISNAEAAKFDQTIPNLLPDTYYAVRAYGVSFGVGYGEVKVIKTPKTSLPAVSTTTASDITGDGVTLMAEVLDNGTSNVVDRGFCYSLTSSEPTINDSRLDVQMVDGEMTAFLGNLMPRQKYYIRAYAVNASGIGYGETFEMTVNAVEVHDTAFVYPPLELYYTKEQVDDAIKSALSSTPSYYEVDSKINDIKNSMLTTSEVEALIDAAIANLASKSDIPDVSGIYLQLESLNKEMNDNVSDLEKLIERNSATLNGMQNEYMKLFEQNKIGIDQLEAAVKAINEEKQKMQETLNTVEEKVASLKTTVDALNSKVATLEADYSVLSSKLDEMSSDLEEQDENILKTLSQHGAEISDLSYRVALLEKKVAELASRKPLPVVIDSCKTVTSTDTTFIVRAIIDVSKYEQTYVDVYGKDYNASNDYYTNMYPVLMTGFVYSMVSQEPTMQNCYKMFVTDFEKSGNWYGRNVKYTTQVEIPIFASAGTYYVRAFAVNAYGTTYSEVQTVKVGPDVDDNQFPGIGLSSRRILK